MSVKVPTKARAFGFGSVLGPEFIITPEALWLLARASSWTRRDSAGEATIWRGPDLSGGRATLLTSPLGRGGRLTESRASGMQVRLVGGNGRAPDQRGILGFRKLFMATASHGFRIATKMSLNGIDAHDEPVFRSGNQKRRS